MKHAALFAAAIALAAPSLARAEPKAWTAAKAALPADAMVVVGIDVAALQQTKVGSTVIAQLISKKDAGKLFDKVKAGCNVDPLAAIQSAVVATADNLRDGAVYLAVKGLDEAKLEACVTAAAPSEAGAKPTFKRTGDVVEIALGKDTYYLGWIGTDVLVVPQNSPDKAGFKKWMSGKGALAKTDAGHLLAKANTAAAIWGAGVHATELQPGTKLKAGYGSLAFAKGVASTELHMILDAPDQAAALAKMANEQIDGAKKEASLPPMILELVTSTTVTSAKDELTLKASVSEKNLAAILQLAMMKL